MAKKKIKGSKTKSMKDLAVKNKKGNAVKGGIVITKVTDVASPKFFNEAVSPPPKTS